MKFMLACLGIDWDSSFLIQDVAQSLLLDLAFFLEFVDLTLSLRSKVVKARLLTIDIKLHASWWIASLGAKIWLLYCSWWNKILVTVLSILIQSLEFRRENFRVNFANKQA